MKITMNHSNTNSDTLNPVGCGTLRENMADLLMEPGFALEHPELELHLAACVPCRTEMTELRATFAALDTWEAPEPSPYFDSRLHAQLRAVREEAPEGMWARLTSFFRYSSNATLRPVLAGALGVLLLAGGGTFAGVYGFHGSANGASGSSATVNDLQRLDNNAQTLQQMGQLLDDSGNSDDASTASPTT